MAEEKEKKDRPAKILGGKKSKKKPTAKGKVKSIHVKKAAGGGFILNHEMEPNEQGMGQPGQEHIAPDLEALKAHMDQHFAGHPAMGEGPEEPPEQAAPAPGM